MNVTLEMSPGMKLLHKKIKIGILMIGTFSAVTSKVAQLSELEAETKFGFIMRKITFI